ncbi:MAG: hypothetical protein FJ254_05040 [Phycisphaerae bacterium]|nr:hypothetical protein [Phycisphaerae bacterium]
MSQSGRRRGLLLMAAGVAVLAIGGGGLILSQVKPTAWTMARARATSDKADARAAEFEKALAAAVHQVRGPEPWAIAIDPADLNGWLAQRWRAWAEFAQDAIPDDLREQPLEHVALAIEQEGSLLVMLARHGRVDWCRLTVVGEPGSVGVEVTGVGVGALPVPVAIADSLAGDLGSLRDGVPPVTLADGRTVRVLDLAFQDGSIVVQCRTDAAPP